MEDLLGRLTNINDAMSRFMDNHAFENGAATKSAGELLNLVTQMDPTWALGAVVCIFAS